ncbi:MAG: recombinase family protein [Clostridia bacterium]
MENPNKLKAALYIRVSTEEQAQDGQSVSAQAETLKQYCSAFDIEVSDVYIDLGLSGKSLKDRQELKRLIEDCGRRQFDMVLVWKISRLSRNLKDLLYLIDIFERNNVHFASCSEKFDTSTPVGRMTLQLLGSIAEFERNTIIENVKLGLKEFARKGGKSTSVLGYDNVNKKLLINEREEIIVKLIFSLYTDNGLSFSAIAEYLNSLGYRTKRGSKFGSSSISYAIHNPVYVGINRHMINTEKEYSIQGEHPAIIDPVVWEKAQNINPKFIKRKASTTYIDSMPLQVACMQCSSPMKIFYAYSKGKKYKYLRCSSCSNYINVEKLEKLVSQAIISLINNKNEQQAVYNLISREPSSYEPRSVEMNSLEYEIKRLQKSKARYLSLFESFKLSDTNAFIDRIAEIEAQLKALEKKKHKLSQAAPASIKAYDYDKYFTELGDKLTAMEPAVLNHLSACLIKSIEAYKGVAKIVLYL